MKLKRIWCFVLGMIFAIILMHISTYLNDWFDSCPENSSYYSCRQYHINGGNR